MHPIAAAELTRALEGPITVDITTIGRRTGVPRRIEIWIVNADGRVVIGGTPGRRDWYANLVADPHITVHFKEHGEVDIDATATPVRDSKTLKQIYEHRSTRWYRERTPVEELVASGPTVELTFLTGDR